jgi:pyruvate formate lyase activating enzyme
LTAPLFDAPSFEKTISICGLTPFTLQDFPHHTACILWFSGCNFRCSYCHNKDIVLRKSPTISLQNIDQFLQERKGLLEGIVLSGGECTLYNDLPHFICKYRLLGYKIKIDTNGSRPHILKTICQKQWVDYVALDYKAPKHLFAKITGNHQYEAFIESLNFLCAHTIDFEVRTTVHTDLMDLKDVNDIILDLDQRGFTGTLYIQNFNNRGPSLFSLPEQKHCLDTSRLLIPQNFSICTRGF